MVAARAPERSSSGCTAPARVPVRPGGTLAFTVADLDAAKAKLDRAGVVVGHEGGGEGLGPRFVEFNDPDGNVLALFEYEEHA